MTILFELMCIIDLIIIAMAIIKGFSITFTPRTKETLMGESFFGETND